jgi:hypothetical protein
MPGLATGPCPAHSGGERWREPLTLGKKMLEVETLKELLNSKEFLFRHCSTAPT